MGVCVCVALVFASALTQNVMLQIEVRSDAGAVADATVVANGTTRRTDSMGRTAFDVPPGPVQIVVAKEGFEPETVSIDIRTGEPRAISIALRPQSAIEEHVTVAATRTDKRIEDQPMRVEILDADEIEEKVMMTPVAANWGLTRLAGGHGQQRTDVDGDGWADLAAYARGVVRPRLFWDNHAGATFFATAGVTAENRNGGTMNGAVVPDGLPYREELDTRRVDGGAAWQTPVAGSGERRGGEERRSP